MCYEGFYNPQSNYNISFLLNSGHTCQVLSLEFYNLFNIENLKG